MKKFKIGIAALLTGVLVLAGSFLCEAAQGEPMSKADFANTLVEILGLEMPAGWNELSDAELFEVQSGMLAERGITLFVDAKPNSKVTSCNLADVLYDALVGPNDASVEEKFDYLADLGYLTASPGYRCEIMSASDILATLNIPALTTVIAEAYSRPVIGGRAAEIPPAPENPETASPLSLPPPETPASPTGGNGPTISLR